MNSGNREELVSAAAAWWGWDTRLNAGLYPEDMGSAVMKCLLAEVGRVKWRGGSAEGRLHSGLGEMRRGCCTLALTLSLLLQQKQFHAPPHIHTNSHTHA